VQDSSWHGTQIAGIVAALTDNAEGIAAASRDGRVLPVRVAGKCGAEVADIIDGMRWAAGLPVAKAGGGFLPANPDPARIISISFGSSAACNPAYQSTIDELAEHGAVVVAAAGNQHAAPMRPANCKGVIGVAALNRDGFKATYSNFGAGPIVATVGGDPTTKAHGCDPRRRRHRHARQRRPHRACGRPLRARLRIELRHRSSLARSA
jgi:serine protease